MSREERAKEYFMQGYACSQAVALTFSDLIGLEEEMIAKLTLPFGGGLGRLRLTCGAVSGMAFVIGAVFTEGENSPENKKKTYAITQELSLKFKEEYDSLICQELLNGMGVPVQVGGEAEARTETYYKKRSCADMVAFTAGILESYLIEQGKL